MTDVVVPAAKPRNINIDSAIAQSSFQLPVFVALSVEGGEAQVAKTFATAHEVFSDVFSVLLDRRRQRSAVEKVEKLVPTSAHLKNSTSTEYVLIVRGKAIFWFGSAAAKRATGRRLLLEHARELVDAEQAPFYVLNTRARKIRATVLALSFVTLTLLAFVIWRVPILWELAVPRNAAGQAVPSGNSTTDPGDRNDVSGDGDGSTPRSHRRPFADFDVAVSGMAAHAALSDAAAGRSILDRRSQDNVAWIRDIDQTPDYVFFRWTEISDWTMPTIEMGRWTNLRSAAVMDGAGTDDVLSQTGEATAASPEAVGETPMSAPTPPASFAAGPPGPR